MPGIRWLLIILVVVIIGSGLCGCAEERTARETLVAPSPMIEKERKALSARAPVEIKSVSVPTPAPPTITEGGAVTPPVCKEESTSKGCYNLRPAGKKADGKSCGRCEPQSLPYARCRSGIMSCRNGWGNSPISWFACEKNNNNTDEPLPGSVLILGIDRGHGMPTGHVAYVEEVIPAGPSSYRLILSHTNYDRRCSLETRIETIYHRDTMTLDVLTGAWKSWGRQLKVAGFILG
jgi:hypothetical protein